MPQSYTPEFKKKIVRLHEEERRTYKSITAEYGVSKAEYDNMKELLKRKRENEELRKENLFLKKAATFLQRKPIRGVSIYLAVSGSVWSALASSEAWHLPKRIL